jgi:hypothetical protein
MTRTELPEPTLAQIERAWVGKPIAKPEEDPHALPPAPSKVAARVDLALLVVFVCLYALAAVGLVFQVGPELVFGAVGAANVAYAIYAFRTHRILGVAFRSRFIARREREPGLYWASMALFAVSGAVLLIVLFTVGR